MYSSFLLPFHIHKLFPQFTVINVKLHNMLSELLYRRPVGSTATIIYIDDFDMVSVEWSDGKLSTFSDKQVINSFEKAIIKNKS